MFVKKRCRISYKSVKRLVKDKKEFENSQIINTGIRLPMIGWSVCKSQLKCHKRTL
jgi:hypothetical protein